MDSPDLKGKNSIQIVFVKKKKKKKKTNPPEIEKLFMTSEHLPRHG